MPPRSVVATIGLLALLTAAPAAAQEGTYDLWLCFEQCDETNREALAYTVAELVLSTEPLDLDSVPSEQRVALDLVDPDGLTVANGCILTHVEAGRVFRPESDIFSLLEWTPTGASGVTIEAPQQPFPYSITLSLDAGVEGTGLSGDQVIFVSGAERVTGDGLRCSDIAGAIHLR